MQRGKARKNKKLRKVMEAGGGLSKLLFYKGVMCCRARVATVALLVIVFVRHPRDTRVIAAIYIGGQ